MAIGGICHPKCLGEGFKEEDKEYMHGERCERIVETADEEGTVVLEHCSVYEYPEAHWREHHRCLMATHYRPDLQTPKKAGKVRVGQQKQKKGL